MEDERIELLTSIVDPIVNTLFKCRNEIGQRIRLENDLHHKHLLKVEKQKQEAEKAAKAAAKAAALDETITSFAQGYETTVGERGVTLSGGQKQRSAIARMLTQETPIMIFDDSLSAVDTQTDAKIRQAISQRFGKASIILISHRITTLSAADQILVLDRGRIAEMGTHQQLKSAGGIYQQIYETQTGTQEELS